jgi:hypothetical protein
MCLKEGEHIMHVVTINEGRKLITQELVCGFYSGKGVLLRGIAGHTASGHAKQLHHTALLHLGEPGGVNAAIQIRLQQLPITASTTGFSLWVQDVIAVPR